MIISGTGSRGQGSKLKIRGSLQLQVLLETFSHKTQAVSD